MIVLSRDVLDLGAVAYDTPAMLSFYGDVLGFPKSGLVQIPGVGTLHRFAVGSNTIKILEPERQPDGPPASGVPWESAGLRYWTVHVTDLDAVLVQLAAAGVQPATGVMVPAPGIRYVLVSDPDGNGIELVEGAA